MSPQILQRWFDGMRVNVSEGTAQIHLNRVRAFFRWATRLRLIISNPTLNLRVGRLPAPTSKPFATDEQRKVLISNLPTIRSGKNKGKVERPDLKFILFAGFYAGMRRNEISMARTTWFDLIKALLPFPLWTVHSDPRTVKAEPSRSQLAFSLSCKHTRSNQATT